VTPDKLRVVDLITTDTDKKFEPAGRMADAIIAILKKHGKCDQQDLKTNGFSKNEIETHWPLAYSLAAVEIRFMSATLGHRRRFGRIL